MKHWIAVTLMIVACSSGYGDLVIQNVRVPDWRPSPVGEYSVMAQSFRLGATFDSRHLRSVAVDLRANTPATAHLWISETDYAGRPIAFSEWVALGSAEVNSTTYQTYEFDSQSPFLLEASTTYAVVLTTDGLVTWHSGTAVPGPGSDPAADVYTPWGGAYYPDPSEIIWKDALTPFVGITVYAVPGPCTLAIFVPPLTTAARRRRQPH